MTKRMSDAAIEQYIASVRKWPVLPSDYGPETEDIIRRILNGDIQPPFGQIDGSPDGDGEGTGAEPTGVCTVDDGQELTATEKRQDAIGNYHAALETIRHKDDKP